MTRPAREHLLDGPDWPESLGAHPVLAKATRANTAAGTLATLLLRDDSARESEGPDLSPWARHGMLLALEICITVVDSCLEKMADRGSPPYDAGGGA